MPKNHVVEQGECLSQIAERYGFGDYRQVYDAPENAELRRKRPNPNVIFPGDVVAIPTATPKTVSAKTGQTHSFVVQRPIRLLRLVIKDHSHRPLANVPYELDLKSGLEVRGSTQAGGKLEVPIPPRCEKAELHIAGRRYLLRLGHLNPMTAVPDQGISGLQGRLKNLGYYGGPVDGQLRPATHMAIALFQHDFGLPADGEPSTATLRKVEQEHGS